MSSITGIVNVDNTITGVEDLYLDTLDTNTIDANTITSTSLSSTTISLNGTDLQTTLTDLQTQITAGGGYFVITCEYNGNWTQGAYWSWGGGVSNNTGIYLPNCTLIAYNIGCNNATPVSATTNTQITKNGTQVALMTIANGGFSSTASGLSLSFSQGDLVRVRFPNTAGQGAGGTAFRCNLVFMTNAVNGTNGSNGLNGTDGQNVNFYAPTFTNLNPNVAGYLTDTITTASNTQNHQLSIGIPRGNNNSFVIGTITNTTGDPSVSISTTQTAAGDNVNTLNFVLKQGDSIVGPAGPRGAKGDQGDAAESTIFAIGAAATAGAAAGVASAAAGAAAASAAAASVNGAIAGAEAGTTAAEGVLSTQNARITTLEGEMDIQQTKTLYINQAGTYTTIGGNGLNVSSTLTAQGALISENGITISSGGLVVNGEATFNNDFQINNTLLVNTIRNKEYSGSGDILIDATNLNVGSTFCDSINLKADNININTNDAAGFTTFGCELLDTDTQVVVQGSLQSKNLLILNNATINNDLLVSENLVAGTDGEFNEHILYGKLFTQTIESISNENPLNIGEETNELQILSNNISIGNLDTGIETQTIINNKNISIGETLVDTIVNIGNANSKITCDGIINTITLDTTNLLIDTSETDITGDITLGTFIDGDTSVLIQNRDISIGTTAVSMTAPTLNMGTIDKTIIEMNSLTYELNAGETATITATNNLAIDSAVIDIGTSGDVNIVGSTIDIGNSTADVNITGSTIDIGNSTADVNIQGSTIDVGTAGVFNTINIGNDYSIVNINTGISQYVNIDNFVNQLGF